MAHFGVGLGLFEAIINADLCLAKVRISNCKLSKPALAKARSRIVPVFQRPEKKLEASLELYKRVKMPLAAQSTKHSSSGQEES